jgi:hypothetical protein
MWPSATDSVVAIRVVQCRPSDLKTANASLSSSLQASGPMAGNRGRKASGFYAASAPTLQSAPSESTNCASTPPKSCFLGGMLKSTPFALMSR